MTKDACGTAARRMIGSDTSIWRISDCGQYDARFVARNGNALDFDKEKEPHEIRVGADFVDVCRCAAARGSSGKKAAEIWECGIGKRALRDRTEMDEGRV